MAGEFLRIACARCCGVCSQPRWVDLLCSLFASEIPRRSAGRHIIFWCVGQTGVCNAFGYLALSREEDTYHQETRKLV